MFAFGTEEISVRQSYAESIALFYYLVWTAIDAFYSKSFSSSYFSIDKVPKVTSPVLVIHGTEDEVIDFSHGLAIYERCPRAVEPLWVEVRKKLLIINFPLHTFISS